MWSDSRYVHVHMYIRTSLLHGDSHGSEEGREERRERDITRIDTCTYMYIRTYVDDVMYLYAIS